MRRTVVFTTLFATALAVSGLAAPIQVTSSTGDSRIDRFGPRSTKRAAIHSTGDLTPGAPGNADGSQEVFLLRTDTFRLVQATDSLGDSFSVQVSRYDVTMIGSREDLTPGVPGNPDRSFESYLWDVRKKFLEQLSGTSEDTFFQTFYEKGDKGLFVSKGDLTPGAPGNPDGENEVYAYDFTTGVWTQLTSSAYESLVRGIDPRSRYAVIQSEGDLTPGAPGNPDHYEELFLLDLGTGAITQLTSSPGRTLLGGVSRDGRYIGILSNGDLLPGNPGNADGSWEFFLYDAAADELSQVTDSLLDSFFAGFDPKSRRAAIESEADLVPGGPGNADGSFEIFVHHMKRRTTTQITDSDGECWFEGFEPRKGKWVAIRSSGDLAPGRPGNTDGSEEIYFARLKRNPARNRFYQATDGLADVSWGGWSPRGRFAAVDTTADLVRGNADGSREVYMLRARRRPPVIQLTDTATDSFVGGFAPDRRTLFIESFGDLDPAGPGNADGSREIFAIRYR